VLGGWQVAGIWRAQTGQPIQITQTGGRPDLLDIKGAINKECCGYGNIQYLNATAFQTVRVVTATSGRTERRGEMNVAALRGPGLWNVDISLGKSISLTEKQKLELKSDIGNVFNHTEYFSSIQTNISSAGFGRFTAARPARTIQVQARIAF
jgi:hypothetical protein